MKKVTYAGVPFVTTDEAAEALIHYVSVMDRYGRGESVRVPILDGAGDVAEAILLVWAGSEIICMPHPWDEPDPALDVSSLSDTAQHREEFRRAKPAPEPVYDQNSEIDTL